MAGDYKSRIWNFKFYIAYNVYRSEEKINCQRKKKYGVQKEHLKYLAKKEFLALRELCRLDPDHALSIELGVNIFADFITTLGTSFLIDGKRIKSFNQWYNKENKRLQSIKDKQNIQQLTKRQKHLLVKRNNILRDFLNKTTRYVINYCLDNGIGKDCCWPEQRMKTKY